jgi:hypothetical protein
VACDLVAIREGIIDKVRARLKERLPDFDPRKIVLSATHTHTAPVMREGAYELPKEGIIQPAQYVEFLAERVCQAAEQAWNARRKGRAGWGLGHAVVAQNRRAVYADGRARCMARPARPTFAASKGTKTTASTSSFSGMTNRMAKSG